MSAPLSLAGRFPNADEAAWRRVVDKALKGAPVERLRARTPDGIVIEPIYPRAAGAVPVYGRAPGAPWRVAQRVDHPEIGAAHDLALADLEGGADGLSLVLAGAPSAYGNGLILDDAAALMHLLDGVLVDAIALRVEAGPLWRKAAPLLAGWAQAQNVAPEELDLSFGADPFGAALATGQIPASEAALAQGAADMASALAKAGFRGPYLAADGRPVHAAWGSDAQELAFLLAAAVSYLRWLGDAGLDDAALGQAVELVLTADVDQTATIAKIRAARLLFGRVIEVAKLPPGPVRIHAETAWRTITRRDPWTNLLRGTVAAFAAGVGGADSVGVLPFTLGLGLPDAFARRLARNIQLILIDEANVHRVADPAAGSGAVEAVATALSDKAWSLFQEIERAGGLFSALAQGAVQARIAEIAALRERDLRRRVLPLIGVSEFPNLGEAPVSTLAAEAAAAASGRPLGQAGGGGASGLGDLASPFSDLVAAAGRGATADGASSAASDTPPAAIAPLSSRRLAEPFEALRDRSDAILAETGARPKVFLATLGRPADFTARATWTKNLFEAGGVAATEPRAHADVATLAAAFSASGARLACLCASDEVYAREAEAAARALKAAGAAWLMLAGRPGENEAAWRAAGIDAFAFAGMDAVAFLEEVLATLDR